MAEPQVLFLGQDLYKLGYVKKLPDISERKTFKRDKIGDNSFQLSCKNYDDMFSIGHAASMLTNIQWMYKPLQMINEDGIVTWNGIVTNITQNQRDKSIVIHSNDIIFSKRNEVIEYESSDWETAADAAKNIMDAYGFTNYDNKSIQASIDLLTQNNAYLKCNFNKSSNVTLIGALEDLGIKSCSDVYSHYGNIYFKHYKRYSGGVSTSLNVSRDTRLKTVPTISYLESQMINQYSIDYDGSGDTPLTDTAGLGSVSRSRYGTRELEVFNTGTGKQIIFKDSTTAKYIGECYIDMTHHNIDTDPQPITKIQFDLDIKFKDYIDLEKYFKLTLTDNAWSEKIFEVYEFKRNEDSRNINIVGYEVNT